MEWLDAIAARDQAAAAGVGCALACATAAALVELTGNLAADRVEAAGGRDDAVALRALGTRAGELRAAALRAADDDARAYAAVTEAAGKAERAAALGRASDPPLAIAEAAAEVGAAAAEDRGGGDVAVHARRDRRLRARRGRRPRGRRAGGGQPLRRSATRAPSAPATPPARAVAARDRLAPRG